MDLKNISDTSLLDQTSSLVREQRSGELSLSVVAQAQRFFRHETVDKKEVLKALEDKSAREAEKELLSRSSEPAVFNRPSTGKISSGRAKN